MFKTSKKPKNLGKMLSISRYKQTIAQGLIPHGMSLKKVNKIKDQVAKRQKNIQACKTYQPFTSNASRRKARQVGA